MAEPAPTGVARISAAFSAAHSEGRAALMPYLMADFPDSDTSSSVAEAYVEAGADLVELGIPFSDPLADGPTIHAAATRALRAGATLEAGLSVCARIASEVPVVPMVYANMILARGAEPFAELLGEAGAAGVIAPDLPLDEAGPIAEALHAASIPLVPLVAPTTPADRRRWVCERAEGFVYVVSDTRVTGERDGLPDGLGALVEAVRRESSVPAAIGFGISTPEQAASVGTIADGVIIGTRLVRAVDEAPDAASAARAVAELVGAARAAIVEAGRRVE